MHIYNVIEIHQYGLGQAEALVLFLVMGIIAFIQIRWENPRRWKHNGKSRKVHAGWRNKEDCGAG
ncbi:MAG: hypothetical protein V8S27_07355 [Lachnospiraceae bacterium]